MRWCEPCEKASPNSLFLNTAKLFPTKLLCKHYWKNNGLFPTLFPTLALHSLLCHTNTSYPPRIPSQSTPREQSSDYHGLLAYFEIREFTKRAIGNGFILTLLYVSALGAGTPPPCRRAVYLRRANNPVTIIGFSLISELGNLVDQIIQGKKKGAPKGALVIH